MTEETGEPKHPRSLICVVLQVIAERRRERRMRRILNEIARRGNDHLLDDIGVGRAAFRECQENMRDRERARRFLWML